MPHQMCRECHRLVSESATTCPHCGIARPASFDDPLARLRPYGSALLLGLVLTWFGGLWFRYQVGLLHEEPAVPAPIPVAHPDSYPGFQSLRGFWLGAPLFARDDRRTYVG